jgi:predicted nuclease with TOPRIM domain
MFKYISDILEKLSTRQRLTALIVLLASIVIITIGPKIALILSQDNEELSGKVERQRTEIEELNKTVSDLSDQIIDGQKSCTDRFVARESEILNMLSNIEREAQKVNTRIKVIPDRIVISDTLSFEDNTMTMKTRPESMVQQRVERVFTGSSPELMRMIKMYKDNIQQKNAEPARDK